MIWAATADSGASSVASKSSGMPSRKRRAYRPSVIEKISQTRRLPKLQARRSRPFSVPSSRARVGASSGTQAM